MQYATIIARNYHAQAEVMARSLLTYDSDARLVMLITDGTEADRQTFASLGVEVALLDDIRIERCELHRMLVYYNVMEMASSMKPLLLRWLLERGNATVCYLDPDVVVYDAFDDIVAAAEQDAIILTPHVLTPFPRDGLMPTEHTILRGGMFNLGFIAVGQESRPFLDWWHERLTTDALFAMEAGLFTDQRWVDFVPVLFRDAICRDDGMNVAHWNMHERGVTRRAGRPATSRGVPIRFIHFSGFDPEHPAQLSRQGYDRPRVVLRAEPDLASLCDEYSAALFSAGYHAWSQEPYRFDQLPHGIRLSHDVRRAYRHAIVEAGDQSAPADPLADGGAALADWLCRRGARGAIYVMTATPETNCAATVVIPSYRSARTLERCMEGASTQRTSIRYRIVVMHSGDEPIDPRVLSRFSGVEFRVFPDRLLPAIKRNWAARDADTPWLLFLDSDCVPGPSWLDTMMAASKVDVVNAIGGSVDIARPWNLTSWVMHLLEFGEWLPAAAAGSCRDFPSCNALYQRELFVAAGGFPETFLPCEDTILNAQLREQGVRLTFLPAAVVCHIHCRSTADILRHNYNFGLSYGLAAGLYGLRGRLLSRSIFFLPLVVAGRFARMVVRVIRYRPHREVMLLVAGFPLIMACLVLWSLGFFRASRASAGEA